MLKMMMSTTMTAKYAFHTCVYYPCMLEHVHVSVCPYNVMPTHACCLNTVQIRSGLRQGKAVVQNSTVDWRVLQVRQPHKCTQWQRHG